MKSLSNSNVYVHQSANRNRYPDFAGISADQWSNSSSNARLRSGSMSSGMNNMCAQRPPNGTNKFHTQDGIPPPRPSMSASVFDLNQVGQRHHHHHHHLPGGYNPSAVQNVIEILCRRCTNALRFVVYSFPGSIERKLHELQSATIEQLEPSNGQSGMGFSVAQFEWFEYESESTAARILPTASRMDTKHVSLSGWDDSRR